MPLGLFAIFSMLQVHPSDFWWHLKTGEIIVTEHRIPTRDEYSFTRYGQPWVNQAWLMQAGLYLVHRVGGLPAIILMHALILTTGFTLLLRAAVLPSSLRLAVLAVTVGAAITHRNWAIRPQSFSFLAFGLLVYLIENHRQGRTKMLWWAPLLFAVWVNAHGGFVFGGALLAMYVIGRLWEFWRQGMPKVKQRPMMGLLACGGASFLALSLNPQGLVGIIRYVLGFWQSTVTITRNIEFVPLIIRESDGVMFFASLALLIVLLRHKEFRLSADQILSLALFSLLTLWARRNAAWYGFVVTPILAAGLQARWGRIFGSWPGIRWANIALLGVMTAGTLLSLPWWRHRLPLPPARRELTTLTTPTAAMSFLCSHAPDGARTYQYQVFGSYQIWACPKLPVFIDSRIELYPSQFWQEYFDIEMGRYNWESITDKYEIRYLFLSARDQTRTIEAARASPRWREIYGDDRAVIFERQK